MWSIVAATSGIINGKILIFILRIGSSSVSASNYVFQAIWDEVGESDEERDKMLLQLEQECLDVYTRKVDQASKSRALLLKSLADSRVELASLLSALGEKTYTGRVSELYCCLLIWTDDSAESSV